MTSAADIAKAAITRAQTMRSFDIRLRVTDGWIPNGTVPFDIRIKDGIATVTVMSESLEDAKNQASIYMESEDFYD